MRSDRPMQRGAPPLWCGAGAGSAHACDCPADGKEPPLQHLTDLWRPRACRIELMRGVRLGLGLGRAPVTGSSSSQARPSGPRARTLKRVTAGRSAARGAAAAGSAPGPSTGAGPAASPSPRPSPAGTGADTVPLSGRPLPPRTTAQSSLRTLGASARRGGGCVRSRVWCGCRVSLQALRPCSAWAAPAGSVHDGTPCAAVSTFRSHAAAFSTAPCMHRRCQCGRRLTRRCQDRLSAPKL